jgi:enoyl-CoA hydratase/carnithine racemase
MGYAHLKYEVEAGILTLTLNRPEKLNAINWQMRNELVSAFDQADADDDVRVVIVTGAGRAFCAGADLSSGVDHWNFDKRNEPADTFPAERDGGGAVTLRMFDLKKPIIGAVNGPATGFGSTFLLPMDIRLASIEARFGFVFTRRGVVMEATSSWFLPRIVGINHAMDWVLTGRLVSAQEGADAGLFNSLHAPADLLPEARRIAAEIRDNAAPISVALCRQLMWKMLGADHPMEAHKLDSRGMRMLGKTPDAREGIASFLEKRPPRFTGKVSTDMPSFYPWWEPRSFS